MIDSPSARPLRRGVNPASSSASSNGQNLVSAKRVWSAPQVSALKVEQTELNNGYWAEIVGMQGCAIYDANASTNVCVST